MGSFPETYIHPHDAFSKLAVMRQNVNNDVSINQPIKVCAIIIPISQLTPVKPD